MLDNAAIKNELLKIIDDYVYEKEELNEEEIRQNWRAMKRILSTILLDIDDVLKITEDVL